MFDRYITQSQEHANARKTMWMSAYCARLTARGGVAHAVDAADAADDALREFDKKFPPPRPPVGREW